MQTCGTHQCPLGCVPCVTRWEPWLSWPYLLMLLVSQFDELFRIPCVFIEGYGVELQFEGVDAEAEARLNAAWAGRDEGLFGGVGVCDQGGHGGGKGG